MSVQPTPSQPSGVGSNPCTNQDNFNKSFRKAIKYNNKENIRKAKPWIYVSLVLWLIFFIWAVLLAMQVPQGPDRVTHLTFAIVFSPAYVLSFYLGSSRDRRQMSYEY